MSAHAPRSSWPTDATQPATCSICQRRCIRRDDGLCGDCRRAARRSPTQPDDWDDVALEGGRWVNIGGIMHWREKVS